MSKLRDSNIDKEIKELMYKLYHPTYNLMTVDDYIEQHTHHYYCEAIINREGLITDVSPNHTGTIGAMLGYSYNELQDVIPIYDEPIDWLLTKSGYVAVWYEMIMYNNDLTKKQEETIYKLIDAGIISKQAKR